MKLSTRLDYQARIQDALFWLEAHQHEDVSPQRLARVAAFSPFHFHRVFRGVSGESVMQCLRRLRLERAALRLRREKVTVTEVALENGFESHEGFTRAFKEHFGAPPHVWRKQQSPRVRRLTRRGPLRIPEVKLRRSQAQPFICTSHRGSFAEVGAAWNELLALAAKHGLFTGTQQLVGRYPDDPEITPPGKVRFDVGFIPSQPLSGPLPRPLRQQQLPGGLWAVAVHRGSYTTLSHTYLELVGGWFPQEGRALADRPCLEFYRNLPNVTAEEELLTEVWAPLLD